MWLVRYKKHTEHYVPWSEIDAGRAAIVRAKNDGSWTVYDEIDKLVVPDDLAKELKGKVRKEWDAFSLRLVEEGDPLVDQEREDRADAGQADRPNRRTRRRRLRANYPDDEAKFETRAAQKPARKK